ncbi:MAG: lipoprotein [Arenicellales bacterium]
MKTIETLLVLLVAAMLLSACGQKGPLYLPQEQPAAATQVNDAEPDGEDKEEKSSTAE